MTEKPDGRILLGWTRSQAGQLIGHAHQQSGQLLTPWQGFGVFALWTAALLCVAAYLLWRREA
jgi:ABC-2 type transport system permease protein